MFYENVILRGCIVFHCMGCHNYLTYTISYLVVPYPLIFVLLNNTEMNMFVHKYLCTYLIWGGVLNSEEHSVTNHVGMVCLYAQKGGWGQ